jgi:hypothetical protein
MTTAIELTLGREAVGDFIASLTAVFETGFRTGEMRRLGSFFARLWEPATTPMPDIAPTAEGDDGEEVRYFIFTVIGRSFGRPVQLGIRVEAQGADHCEVVLTADEAWCADYAVRYGGAAGGDHR